MLTTGLTGFLKDPRGSFVNTVFSLQHVDTGNSYLCGYLKIKGLTEVSISCQIWDKKVSGLLSSSESPVLQSHGVIFLIVWTIILQF